MRNLFRSLLVILFGFTGVSCSRVKSNPVDAAATRAKLDAIPLDQEVRLTSDEWHAVLTPGQFYVMRRAGTERPSGSGNTKPAHHGAYFCSACGNPLFLAETKFDSGTGWPSFFQPLRKEAVREASGSIIFGKEISCARCGSHLGHVFNDGPAPTGLRYCMNAVALDFREAK